VKFEFFDHTADLGAMAYGATREELFQNAAAALYHALGRFELKPERTTQHLKLQSNSIEELLVEFVGELLFRFDAHRLLFDQIEIRELQDGHLAASLSGAEVDLARSEPNYEIKAVTYHQTRIEPTEGGWKATLVFDV
jgi:SHS2 domain-containing protein